MLESDDCGVKDQRKQLLYKIIHYTEFIVTRLSKHYFYKPSAES